MEERRIIYKLLNLGSRPETLSLSLHAEHGRQAGKGSATLSMAYAAAVFAESCLKAMSGEANVRDYAYVESSVTDLPFFASRVLLGKEGVEEVEGLGSLNAAEAAGLEVGHVTSSVGCSGCRNGN